MDRTHLTAGVAAAVLVGAGLTASSATAAVTDHQVRPGDLTTGDHDYATSDTRSTGHRAFLKEGVRLWTEGSGNTDKVAEYFPVNRPLAGITDVEYEWFGTAAAPGAQYVVDLDGDGSQDGILVGEKKYGGQDVWLTDGSKAIFRGAGAPSNSDGSGSSNHGTLEQWSHRYPQAEVLYGGFALGAGVKGDGVLRSITYGNHRYVFSDQQPVTVPDQTHKAVTGSGVFTPGARRTTFTMRADAQPANDTGKGKRLRWQIKVDGVQRYSTWNGWYGVTAWTWEFPARTGTHKVVVLRNGKVYKRAQVPTR